MLLWGLLFITIIPAVLGVYMGYKLLHPHRVSSDEAFQKQLENGEISGEFIRREKRNFILHSDFGYNISGFYFPGSGQKTIIFCHGISWNKLGSAKYLEQFLNENWNIFLYDHRGAGESGGKYPSFGYYEKFDLKKVKEYATYLYPDTEIWGLFGESMGGATVLQYAPMDSSLSFIVAVCPFSDLEDLMNYHLQKFKFPNFICPYVLYFANQYLKVVGKFSASDVCPLEAISSSSVPLFLSHGTEDKIVPFYMGKHLKESREKMGPTLFLEGTGSGHTPYLYQEHRDEFEKTLDFFLKSYAKS